MKNTVKLFGIALLGMAIIFVMAACKTDPDLDEYTVTFEANGGNPAPAAQTVSLGGKVTEPSGMTKSGSTFAGWYREAGFTTKWDFASDTVSGDITLYAKWANSEYTVTFNSNGGSNVVEISGITPETTITLPVPPAREGYIFAAWYMDNNTFLNEFTSSTIVTGDITVYAKWTLKNDYGFGGTWVNTGYDTTHTISINADKFRMSSSSGGFFELSIISWTPENNPSTDIELGKENFPSGYRLKSNIISKNGFSDWKIESGISIYRHNNNESLVIRNDNSPDAVFDRVYIRE